MDADGGLLRELDRHVGKPGSLESLAIFGDRQGSGDAAPTLGALGRGEAVFGNHVGDLATPAAVMMMMADSSFSILAEAVWCGAGCEVYRSSRGAASRLRVPLLVDALLAGMR